MRKKLLIILMIGFALFAFSTETIFAAGEIEEYQAALEEYQLNGRVSQDSFTQTSWEKTQGSIIFSILGGKPEAVADGNGGKKITYTKGMVGDMSKVIAMMYGYPAATTDRYIADLLHSAGVGIAKPVYAQGLGFASLDPVLETWKTFRNIAYLFFVVIILIIGFMIMLRQKIGGQTVVTAQQAIPSIIVALILVTFSYAIAGLLIDMMYLVMYLLLALFGKDNNTFLNKNFLTLGVLMIKNGSIAALDVVSDFATQFQNTLGSYGDELVNFLGGLTLAVVVAIAIALNIFKLFFELLKTYVTIVLTVALAPVLLMFGAIPGKNPFKQWLADIIGNLVAFPTVLLVLIIFDELTGGISNTGTATVAGGFSPPYLFGGLPGDAITGGILPFIVGLGMLMILPEIVKEAKKAAGAKEGIFTKFAGDVGKALGTGWKGGELIPGFGPSDTSKWPMGGLSGGNVFKKTGIAGSTIAGGTMGGAAGAIGELWIPGAFGRNIKNFGAASGRRIADAVDDKQMFTAGRELRKQGKLGYADKPPKKEK